MRRLRPLNRRDRQRQRAEQLPPTPSAWALDGDQPLEDEPQEFVPFVPVSRELSPEEAEPDAESAPPEPARRRGRPIPLPRVHIRRPALGIEIRFSALLLALIFIIGGIFGTLLIQGEVRKSLKEWWPLVMLTLAVLWMLTALFRRQVASFLGGAALAGVGLSLLMDTQHIAVVKDTLLGVVLVTVGLGIVIRGFLLRQQTSL